MELLMAVLSLQNVFVAVPGRKHPWCAVRNSNASSLFVKNNPLYAKPLPWHNPDAVEKIAGEHPLPSLELNFTCFEQCLLAANNEQLAAARDQLAWLRLSIEGCRRGTGPARGGPKVNVLAAKGSVRAGPGSEAAHAPRDLFRGERPIDAAILLLQHRRQGGELMILRNRNNLTALPPAQRLHHQFGPDRAQTLPERLRGVVAPDLDLALQQNIARIQSGVDPHRGDAGHALAANDRPGNWSRPAVLGQQRGVQVEAAKPRQRDHPGRQDVTVGNDNDQVRLNVG